MDVSLASQVKVEEDHRMFRRMFRKSAKKENPREVLAESKTQSNEDESSQPHFQARPRICLIDVEEKICESFRSSGFNCFVGTLGSIVEVPNQDRRDAHPCLVTYKFPQNIHEYEIVIIDLQNKTRIPYRPQDHQHSGLRGQKQPIFLSSFPETLFDPRAFSSLILGKNLSALLQGESLLIVFAAENEAVEYFPGYITANGFEKLNTEIHGIYDFIHDLPANENIAGEDTKVVIDDHTDLERLLQAHNSESTYQIIFHHPTHWDGNRRIKIPSFIPLIASGKDQVVSFKYELKYNRTFFFPRIMRKEEFLIDLFQKVLPRLFPKLFPYSTAFRWLKDQLYHLPNEGALQQEITLLQVEDEQKTKEIEGRILTNQKRYKFLHDLLIESDGKLVKTVEVYFKWIGFENVINMDETDPEILQEDLQVETNMELLVIEVKGIGGTSTDSECSQINKIKYRRAKERRSFDVYALYLVNHQRFVPPKQRTNPPFNKTQIQDAENDERGLLSTYDLFKLYFNIEAGFVTKEDARKAMFQNGLVRFLPSSAVKVQPPYEIHHNGYVVIVELRGILITTGEAVILDEDGLYKSSIIKEIQIDGKTVDVAECGEVGIRLEDKITKRTQLWLKVGS